MRDYQLIRLVVCEPAPQRPPATAKCLRFFHSLRERRQTRLHTYMEKKLCAAIGAELSPLLDEMGDNYLFYGDTVPQDCWLRGALPLREFDAWLQPKWLRELLVLAPHVHFVVLGSAPCLQELLQELAPRMKSLLWIAPDLTYQEQLEEFAEDFYQEYGLAVNLHFLPVNSSYGQLSIQNQRYLEPVNVLDFTGERYVPLFSPPEGSVWLDMMSVREKESRIEARRLKVKYFSLKKLWQNAGAS